MKDRRFVTYGLSLLTTVACAAGCSKVFLQDDGFGVKVRAGCASEDACRRLQLEAEQRTITCKDNTVGFVRCDDARADKLMADAYLKEYDQARQRRAEDARKTEVEQQRIEVQRAHDEQERRRDQERRVAEREQLSTTLASESRVVETCNASEAARASRRRHADILQNQAPAATVRKQCAPRHETSTITAQCTDANGFRRSCTKTVAGDVIGYTCPKTLDPEIVQLGLYQLDLLDAYPYPEDRAIRIADAECDRAKTRAEAIRQRLEALGEASTEAVR